MKFHFEADQPYQQEAIKTVIDLFKGQQLQVEDSALTVSSNTFSLQLFEDMAVANTLSITKEQIAKNTHAIQKAQKLPLSETEGAGFSVPAAIPLNSSYGLLKEGLNFTLEMETGTGKTYVYLRTILELHKEYGFKKFIIVVPSLAIKEGVIKNLEITKDHFNGLYNNPKMDSHVWDPKKRGLAKAFATNNSLQILVLTIDSFTRSQNIIHQQSDWGMPIEFISKTRPIVIVDEPQSMETEIRRNAIQSLNPLCTLRYSATHSRQYNLIYKLDPVKAYDLGLVKRIEVDSVQTIHSFNTAHIQLIEIERKGKSDFQVLIEADVETAAGVVRQQLKIHSGDDLAAITGREVYKDYILDRINLADNCIEFTNGEVFYAGQNNTLFKDEVVKFQISRTIEDHLEKELVLRKRNIKVLSLFFIDKVANYRLYENGNRQKGKFAVWFEEAYKTITAKPKFKDLLSFPAGEVHNGYFSQDRNGAWKDTRGDTIADDDTYELIMKDKEKLLDPDVPLRFIFSHSALREGWDNPNVFQICTLNETVSNSRKRQEIGRGLRLPVDRDGYRVRDTSVNILTVIANESYERFAKSLQTEIEEETGVAFGDRIKNKRDRKEIVLKKGYSLDPHFKDIWDRIKTRTKYNVSFEIEKLVEESAKRIAEISVQQPRITSTRAELDITGEGITSIVRDSSARLYKASLSTVPDVVGRIQSRTKLTRGTIMSILIRSGKLADCTVNPQQIIDEASARISQVMTQSLVDGIKYEKIAGQEWEMQSFANEELSSYIENLYVITEQEKTLFDHIIVDSEIERSFARELENRRDVRFFFKLPGWFKIDTPLGGYNPDWAILFEGDTRLYFVAETKGTNDLYDPSLSESERMKILCGKRHFKLFEDITYKAPVRTVDDVLG